MSKHTLGPWERDEEARLIESQRDALGGAVRRTVADTTDLLTAALASLNNGNPGPAVARERIEAALDELRALRAALKDTK